jgi:hypothetical protein
MSTSISGIVIGDKFKLDEIETLYEHAENVIHDEDIDGIISEIRDTVIDLIEKKEILANVLKNGKPKEDSRISQALTVYEKSELRSEYTDITKEIETQLNSFHNYFVDYEEKLDDFYTNEEEEETPIVSDNDILQSNIEKCSAFFSHIKKTDGELYINDLAIKMNRRLGVTFIRDGEKKIGSVRNVESSISFNMACFNFFAYNHIDALLDYLEKNGITNEDIPKNLVLLELQKQKKNLN